MSQLFADIDGFSIPDLGSYRAHSPTFNVSLPPDNLFGVPAGSYGPSAVDGYHLLVLPTQLGPHTVHFGGVLGDGTLIEATYHLNVVA